MRLPKHCAAAVMLALVISQSAYCDERTQRSKPDAPAMGETATSNYPITAETLELQGEIGRAMPFSHTRYFDPPPPMSPVTLATLQQVVTNDGHPPMGDTEYYEGDNDQAQFSVVSAGQFRRAGSDDFGSGCDVEIHTPGCGCDTPGCGCDTPGCGCDTLGCDGVDCECNGCDSAACAVECDDCYACWQHGHSIFAEFLYLHATGVDLAHAQQQNGIGGAGTVPFGRIGTVDPKHEPGLRAGFNIALDDCSSIRATYTYFQSHAVDRVDPPFGIGAGLPSVGSLVHHPGAAITASAGPVDATYDIDFDLVEIEYRRLWYGCDDWWLNYSIGARYGRLEQRFLQTGIFAGGAAGAIDTETAIDFDGAGVKIGLDGESRFGCHGFSVYGRTSLSPLVGEYRSDYSMLNRTTDVQLALASWQDDRFTTILDYEVGVAWTGACNHLRLSAGYYAMFWFNAVSTPEFIQAVQNDNYVDVSDTISFDGLTARVEWRF